MTRRAIVSVLGAASLLAASVAGTSSASALAAPLSGAAAQDATGTFYGLSPKRLLDTRKSGARQPLAAGSTTTLTLAGFNGIPSTGASAVVINLTAVTTTSQGYFTVYPSGASRPTASSINFPAGWTGANMVTVPLGADGKLKLYNYGGPAHAIVDVLGWYAKDDSVQATQGMGTLFWTTSSGDPERRYDSRTDPEGAFVGGTSIEFDDDWATTADAAAVQSYVVNVTAVDATGSGVITLWQGGATPKPTVSTVNYTKGTIAPNMAVVPAGHYNSLRTGFMLQNTGSGSVHVVVDLVGYYLSDQTEGMRFVPRATPKRLVDTRKPLGPDTVLTGAFGTSPRTIDATSVTTSGSYLLVANTTGVKPTTRTYLTAWSGENPRPSASNLNINAGVVRSASTYAPLRNISGPPEERTFAVYNNAGSMHLVIDVAGTLDYYSSAAASPAASLGATSGAATLPRAPGSRHGVVRG